MEIKVVPMTAQHVDQVVRIHLNSFQGFFLSFLGPRFLRALYHGLQNDERSLNFVAFDDAGRMVGFVAGTQDPSGFYGRLIKKDAWRFCLASLEGVLKKPSIMPRLFRALRQPSNSPAGGQTGLLMSIAVVSEAQGSGAGKKLVEAFLAGMAQKGVKDVYLTTDRDHNQSVNRFYQKNGFTISRVFVTAEGRGMNEFHHAL